MDKDVTTSPEEPVDAGLISGLVRSRRFKYTLFFGGAAGIAVGILNLMAAANEWKLKEIFDTLDYPVMWVVENGGGRANIIDATDDKIYVLSSLLVVICYWPVIGLLGGLFVYFRGGVIKDINRDKTCRRVLLFGTCGGMLMGCLNLIAALNGWALERWFEVFARPALMFIDAVGYRFHFSDALPGDRDYEIYIFLGAVVLAIYWAIVGFILALLYCAMRIIRMKKESVRGIFETGAKVVREI